MIGSRVATFWESATHLVTVTRSIVRMFSLYYAYTVTLLFKLNCRCFPLGLRERGGLVVNASDSGSRGRGFEPHSGQTVLCH